MNFRIDKDGEDVDYEYIPKCDDVIINKKVYSLKNSTCVRQDIDYEVKHGYDMEHGSGSWKNLWITNKGNWFLTRVIFNYRVSDGSIFCYTEITEAITPEEAKLLILGNINVYRKEYNKYFPNDPIEEA